MIWKVKGNMKGKYFNFIFLINYVDLSFIVVLFSLMKLQKIYFRYVLWFEDGSISSVCVDNYTAGLGFHQWSRNKK